MTGESIVLACVESAASSYGAGPSGLFNVDSFIVAVRERFGLRGTPGHEWAGSTLRQLDDVEPMGGNLWRHRPGVKSSSSWPTKHRYSRQP